MHKLDEAFLFELLTSAGPSSFEDRPLKVWREKAVAYGARVESDSYGNSFARFNSHKSPLIMLISHIDEIGLIVTHIDKSGFIYFDSIGGWDVRQLIGQRVRLVGQAGTSLGVIGCKPIHLLTPDERKRPVKIEDLWIDIGAVSDKEAHQYARVGDCAVIEQPPVHLLNGRIASKAVDNRVAAYASLEVARLVNNTAVVAVASVQEEIGGPGAAAAAFGVQPDLAVVIDVTHATDIPSADVKRLSDVRMGAGPNFAVGSFVHRSLLNLLIETATNLNIPFTLKTVPQRTLTDADEVAKVRAGIPTAVVSLPNRYMHSSNEMFAQSDLEDLIELLKDFCERVTPALLPFRQ